MSPYTTRPRDGWHPSGTAQLNSDRRGYDTSDSVVHPDDVERVERCVREATIGHLALAVGRATLELLRAGAPHDLLEGLFGLGRRDLGRCLQQRLRELNRGRQLRGQVPA